MEEPGHTHWASHHDQGWVPHNEAGTTAGCDETYGLHHPYHLHLHQTMGLRVTEVQYQLLCQCHQGLIDQEAPGMHTMANVTGSLEAI